MNAPHDTDGCLHSRSFVLKHLSTVLLAGTTLIPCITGCKPKEDAALEHAKEQAASTGQAQQIVSTDKNGNTVTTVVQPPVAGQQGQVVTTTVTPKSSSTAVSGQTGPAAGQTSAAIPATSQPAGSPPASPAPQVHVTAGTALVIRINQRISAKGSHAGEHFTGDVEEPVLDDSNQIIIPKGSDVRGVVQVAASRGNFKGAAELKLRLTSLKLNGTEYPLDTQSVVREKKGKGKRTAGFIGGGTGLGLLLGGLAGGGRGAAIGGLAGAGAGTAGAGLTDNGDLVIPAESVVRFKLADDLVIDSSPQ